MTLAACLYLLAGGILAYKVARTLRGKKPPAFGRDWL